MKHQVWMRVLLVAGVFLVTSTLAQAQTQTTRQNTQRTDGQKTPGVRGDITVPYLTTGNSAFMGKSVAPKIYSSPIVDDPENPQAKPVYNLIFWGSVLAFGDKSEGATPRPKK